MNYFNWFNLTILFFNFRNEDDNPANNLLDFNGINSISPSQTTNSSLDQLINLNYSSSNSLELEANSNDVNSNSVNLSSEMLFPSSGPFACEDNNSQNNITKDQTIKGKR